VSDETQEGTVHSALARLQASSPKVGVATIDGSVVGGHALARQFALLVEGDFNCVSLRQMSGPLLSLLLYDRSAQDARDVGQLTA
jgi:hypothetical protein